MKKRLLKICLYAIVFIITLELLAHTGNAKDAFFRRTKGLQPGNSFNSITIRDEIGSKGLAYGQWNKIKLNKFGFNGKDNYDKTPKDNTIRIMCLGDSVTFGTFTAPVNWPGLLEKKLISQGLDVEVLNAAFPGNTLPQIIKRFETEYLEFQPHYLLVLKECRHYMAGSDRPASKMPLLTRMALHSSFLTNWCKKNSPDPKKRLRKRRMLLGVKKTLTTTRNKDITCYENDLRHLIEICKKNGITPVLAPTPTLVNIRNKDTLIDIAWSALWYYPNLSIEAYLDGKIRFNNAIKNVAHKQNIPFVNLPETVAGNESYFTDDYHLTIEGTEKVAEEYEKILLPLIKNANAKKQSHRKTPVTSIIR